MCAQIFRCFESRDPEFMVRLFNTYVLPKLEYAAPVWSPHFRVDVDCVERVQRLFTRRLSSVYGLMYEQRLAKLNMKSLEHRRLYLDLIMMYKIVHGLISVNLADINIVSVYSGKHLRNYGYALHVKRVASSSHFMYAFVFRTLRIWNILPKSLVKMSLLNFKKHLY